jgi:hypothetical protein
MQPLRLGVLMCVILILTVSPVQALTAEELDITVSDNGDADISFSYSLSWIENFAVFLRIADPAAELKSALESNFNKPVQVISVGNRNAHIIVDKFASVKIKDGRKVYTTPSMSFSEAEATLSSYWFAPLVTPDFSPSQTVLVFPDGYRQVFYNELNLPSVTHAVSE